MPEPTVYCQMLGGAIPESFCSSEQGVSGCRGCNARTRLCEKCLVRPSTRPEEGRCDICAQAEFKPAYCKRCHKNHQAGAETPYCANCQMVMSELVEVTESSSHLQALLGKVQAYTRIAAHGQEHRFSFASLEQHEQTEKLPDQTAQDVAVANHPVKGGWTMARKTPDLSLLPSIPGGGNNPEQLCQLVATYYGVRTDEMLSTSREHTLVVPRQVLMYLLRQTGLSFPAIGALLGREHSTIMHGCAVVGEQCKKDATLRLTIASILSRPVGGQQTTPHVVTDPVSLEMAHVIYLTPLEDAIWRYLVRVQEEALTDNGFDLPMDPMAFDLAGNTGRPSCGRLQYTDALCRFITAGMLLPVDPLNPRRHRLMVHPNACHAVRILERSTVALLAQEAEVLQAVRAFAWPQTEVETTMSRVQTWIQESYPDLPEKKFHLKLVGYVQSQLVQAWGILYLHGRSKRCLICLPGLEPFNFTIAAPPLFEDELETDDPEFPETPQATELTAAL